jgi:hypothetical protein
MLLAVELDLALNWNYNISYASIIYSNLKYSRLVTGFRRGAETQTRISYPTRENCIIADLT